MSYATEQCIPRKSKSKHKGIPDWKTTVAPLRQKALFWRNIWRECGSPSTGVTADIMRFTRSKYHQAVRNAKKKKLVFVNDSLARSLCDTSKCDFWKRVKAIKNKVQYVPTVIDGISDDTDIAEIFADRYRTLYNCTAYDKNKMATLENVLKC